ncbi:hypothetical protein FPC831_300007 [Flavobacterium psychrophilum]|nr:hypothetical protein FPC831_300007 [Flavobacterium psychrophilum]SNB18155.1 hypothetical protein JIP1600_3000005 [Flavobacterium psychrophilum]SNB23193.1 hypothetical protein KU06062604_90007 [Flavobacterium psychrophilum]
MVSMMKIQFNKFILKKVLKYKKSGLTIPKITSMIVIIDSNPKTFQIRPTFDTCSCDITIYIFLILKLN